jgi:RNA polymerase sigma factor for flagellar operon FliA
MAVDVSAHVKLVAQIARSVAQTLPAHVRLEDLVSAGYLGLLDAANRYDPARNDNFEAYAQFRIRGAIMDDLRERDTLSREMRQLSNRIEAAAAQVALALGRVGDSAEVAAELWVSVERLNADRQKLAGWSVVGLDDTDEKGLRFMDREPDPRADDPFEQAVRSERSAALMACIEQLPEQMHRVLSLYYMKGLTFAQVGIVLGVTESRVCQVHGEATKLLRETCVALQEYRDEMAA